MKIVRMNKVENFGKLRAFFDLLTGDGFTIKGFKIMEGINGLYVSMPSTKDKDGKYNDDVYCVKEIKDNLKKLAIEHYKEALPDSTTTISAQVKQEVQDYTKQKSDDENIPF